MIPCNETSLHGKSSSDRIHEEGRVTARFVSGSTFREKDGDDDSIVPSDLFDEMSTKCTESATTDDVAQGADYTSGGGGGGGRGGFSTRSKFHDLLGEAQHYLSLSMLVYMYAQLREMAVLGYTESDFRLIDVNSYLPWEEIDDNVEEDGTLAGASCDSSVRREHKQSSTLSVDPDEKSVQSWRSFTSAFTEHGYPSYLLNTMSAASIIRIILSEIENEKMVENDGFSTEHDSSIVKEFRNWVEDSKAKQLDGEAERAIIELRERAGLHSSRSSLNLSLGSSGNFGGGGGRRSSIRSSLTLRCANVGHDSSPYGSDDSADHNDTEVNKKNESKNRHEIAAREMEAMAMDETKTAIDEELLSYFKKRSVISRMIESGSEVAWCGDRHRNEAIYCICVCRETCTVTVVFRGSVTAHNWLHNMKVVMSESPNPVSHEDYDGRTNRVRLHTGFSLYLLRKRRDDKRRKFDEICHKVHCIGKELAPDGKYRLSVAGHSLGGALATIFSFYAAADKRFTSFEPIRVFTFAAPRVGDISFANAYRHLERTGRAMHARFANCSDIVPLVPMVAFHGMKMGPRYEHVGLQVRLHEVNMRGKEKLKRALDVSHAASGGQWTMLQMAWKNNVMFNINTINGYGEAHKLSSHQKRLNFARQFRIGLGHTEFVSDTRRRHLKSLEEYYCIKANIPSNSEDARKDIKTDMSALVIMSSVLFAFFVLLLVLLGDKNLQPMQWLAVSRKQAREIAALYVSHGLYIHNTWRIGSIVQSSTKESSENIDSTSESGSIKSEEPHEDEEAQLAQKSCAQDGSCTSEMNQDMELEKETHMPNWVSESDSRSGTTISTFPTEKGVRIWGLGETPTFFRSDEQFCDTPIGLPLQVIEFVSLTSNDLLIKSLKL